MHSHQNKNYQNHRIQIDFQIKWNSITAERDIEFCVMFLFTHSHGCYNHMRVELQNLYWLHMNKSVLFVLSLMDEVLYYIQLFKHSIKIFIFAYLYYSYLLSTLPWENLTQNCLTRWLRGCNPKLCQGKLVMINRTISVINEVNDTISIIGYNLHVNNPASLLRVRNGDLIMVRHCSQLLLPGSYWSFVN